MVQFATDKPLRSRTPEVVVENPLKPGRYRFSLVVVDDSDGIAAELDAAMERSVGAYRDPWQDGKQPVTEGQFRSSLPLLALPQVPVR